MKLSELACKNAKHKNPNSKAPMKLSDGEGLSLWVMPNGAKYWRFAYRFGRKQKSLAIGVYPETSLKEARMARFKAREDVDEGKDPNLEKKKKKVMVELGNANTFKTIAYEWYENRKHMWQAKYAVDIITRLEADIFPEIGDYPIKDIEPPLLLHSIRKIEKRGATDLAKRQLQKCGEVFRYAIATGMATRDPSRDITGALKPHKQLHFAALDPSELPELLRDINSNKARLFPTTINAMKLMMLTFVRTTELLHGTWKEIDFEKKMWTIPAERMKTNKVHLVPLSDQAIKILKEQKNIAGKWPWIFPSPVRPRQAISNNAILVALKRMGYQGRMTGHGFRALAMSSIKQELGWRHEVVDRQLAHQPKNKIDRAYDRALFLDDRKKMMQEWTDYIDRVKS